MTNEQEHRISYKAGITRTPSDFLCQDGELAECINLTTDNEELKPIVQPAEYISAAYDALNNEIDMPTFLYIHKFTGDRYIGYVEETEGTGEQAHIVNVLHWGTLVHDSETGINTYEDEGALLHDSTQKIYYTEKLKITSIGKVLIISSEENIYYFSWKQNTYKCFNDIPTPNIKFYLTVPSAGDGFASNSGNTEGIIDFSKGDSQKIQDKEEYNNLVTGLYSKTKKAISQIKSFCNPFLVRCAIELNNGTYTKITNPVMMFPSVTSNSHVRAGVTGGKDNLLVGIWGFHLYYSQSIDYTDFADIVKSLVIFVSEPVDLYDLNVDQDITTLSYGDVIRDCIIWRENEDNHEFYSQYQQYTSVGSSPGFDALKKKDTQEVINSLKASSVFYKLCEIGIKPSFNKDTAELIETHTLENLVTMPRLQYDDYYSNTRLYPEFVFSYNSRLNIANVARSFFEGFHHFLPYDNPTDSTYYFYVKIETDTGNVWIKHTKETNEKQGLFFFYPDPRAKHVTIYKKEEVQESVYEFTCVLDADLTEHRGLNGAYYFDALPTSNYTEPSVTVDPNKGYVITEQDVDDDTADNDKTEELPNYIITSDVNNPYVFLKEGYNKVGTGKILAMSTTTMALSQDQFGKTDLIVFSESGVWGMEVDKTGLFQGLSPVTRDVLINPHNVIQTDGAVFFVTKKGLMVISERVKNGTQCVSEQMNGKPFIANSLDGLKPTDTQPSSSPAHDWAVMLNRCSSSLSFLDYIRKETCQIAYDYIESRLLIIDSDPLVEFSYAMNIKDGTISKIVLPFTLMNVVNNYPDYLLQATPTLADRGKLYSFYEKPREEGITTRQLAFMLTRPMKLDGPVTVSSLRQLKNVGMWSLGTQLNPVKPVQSQLYLSDDLINWYKDDSRMGAAAKYYRLALFINMLPSERLSGTIITTQPRRTNNFR